MDESLDRRTLRRRVVAAGAVFDVILFLLLFLPAGTLAFWQAWVYWGLFTAYLVVGSAWWLRSDPDFLRRRLKAGPWAEKLPREKMLVGILYAYLFVWFAIPGFDHRFQWSEVPPGVTILGFVMCILGLAYVVYTAAYNHYMAATVTAEERQPVVSTGPYAWIRHPMYAGSLLWFFFTPLALGSWWGVLATLPMPVILVFRIFDEERFLRENLAGYAEYCRKVRWRLVPFLF